MANVVVLGAGMVGLGAAAMLARDGHRVTVLERDPAAAPSPVEAWDRWERRGVPQFRQLHQLNAGWRRVVERELPGLVDQLLAAGALTVRPGAAVLAAAPDAGDDEMTLVTARRPVAEAVTARHAEQTPGVEVRRGVAVRGLRTGAPVDGVPHVVGVRTADGDDVDADLVVDASGRRSALPAWLADLPTRPAVEEREDLGFTYHGRHFRSADGTTPDVFGPFLQSYGSISVLTLPSDNGTWAVGVITVAGDVPLRPLRDDAVWESVVRACPLAAHWLEGEPLSGVEVMTGIEDRLRDLVVDGRPVVTGVVTVGDAWACTNPSLGRGVSIGFAHAAALRAAVAEGGADAVATARSLAERTAAEVEPWYRATLRYDRHRLAEAQAAAAGQAYEGDEWWARTKACEEALLADPAVLRAYIRTMTVLDLPEVAYDDDIVGRARAASGAGPLPGPDRGALLALVDR